MAAGCARLCRGQLGGDAVGCRAPHRRQALPVRGRAVPERRAHDPRGELSLLRLRPAGVLRDRPAADGCGGRPGAGSVDGAGHAAAAADTSRCATGRAGASGHSSMGMGPGAGDATTRIRRPFLASPDASPEAAGPAAFGRARACPGSRAASLAAAGRRRVHRAPRAGAQGGRAHRRSRAVGRAAPRPVAGSSLRAAGKGRCARPAGTRCGARAAAGGAVEPPRAHGSPVPPAGVARHRATAVAGGKPVCGRGVEWCSPGIPGRPQAITR